MTNKISSLFSNKPIQTEIDGIYIQDLPAKEVEESFGSIDDLLKENPEEGITKLFTDLICDAEGQPFEDCQTYDGITANLSIANIRKIVDAAGKALMGEEVAKN